MLIRLLVVSPWYCTSFSTSQNPSHRHHNIARSHIQVSTFLLSGRERRISNQEGRNESPAEQKLVADEELARQRRIGQMEHRLRRSASREDRISALELKLKNSEAMPESKSFEYMTKAERKELDGLLEVRNTFEEQYDPLKFTKEHLDFKSMHNDAFIQLSKYCERERNRVTLDKDDRGTKAQISNVFFLDGPDGGTASALIIERGGFDPSQCFVANRHKSSCDSLRMSGGGLLPDENVVHATASEALTLSAPICVSNVDVSNECDDDIDAASVIAAEKDGEFAHVDFVAYYFDGCGGFVPHVIGMLSAALIRENDCMSSWPIAVGYSLLGGNKDVVGKELAVSQALAIIARRRGMRMVHVLDEPSRYGISCDIQKIGGNNGGTFTTWLLLEPKEEISN